LKGREVAEILDQRKFPVIDVKLLDDDESLGQLEAVGDEVTFVQSVGRDQFENLDFALFAGDPATTLKSWKLARDAGVSIVDLSFALEDEPGTRVRSPWVEKQLGQDLQLELQPGPAVVVAHPAAVILALLVLRGQKAGALRSAVATVFEPVSERGRKGIEELQLQSVNLLSFQEMPREIFDTQVGFNLVRRYGSKSATTLESVEHRIATHYRRIAGENAPGLSLALLQAPVFHGYSLLLFLETEEPVVLGDMAQALQGEHVVITRTAEEPPTTVAAAGQDDILLSVTRDAGNPNGLWIWAAADNLRVSARTAVELAESIAASRPKGPVQ
jgi:aspartate-semialdehyde dehydrogenase